MLASLDADSGKPLSSLVSISGSSHSREGGMQLVELVLCICEILGSVLKAGTRGIKRLKCPAKMMPKRVWGYMWSFLYGFVKMFVSRLGSWGLVYLGQCYFIASLSKRTPESWLAPGLVSGLAAPGLASVCIIWTSLSQSRLPFSLSVVLQNYLFCINLLSFPSLSWALKLF